MSYIDNHLLKDEKVVYRTVRHWIIFVLPIILLIIGFIFAMQSSVLQIIGWMIVLIGGVQLTSAAITYRSSEFGVTNKRVLVKIGFIRRQSLETVLVRIAGIKVEQGVLGRLLGYGTITIQSTGNAEDRFTTIDDPLQFRRKVQEQIEQSLTTTMANQIR